MTDNEIIIYGFHLGNSDPEFQRFVRSMSNEDVHNLRKILYESKQNKYKDGYAAAIYGRDSYGIVNIPQSIKMKNWEESEKELFPFIKDLWVASVLGFDNPGLNPVKNHQWRTTRLRAVTSYNEGMDAIKSVGLEIGLSYIGAKGLLNPAARQMGQALSTARGIHFNKLRYNGKVTGFSISRTKGYGAKPRIDYHRLGSSSKASNSISPGQNKKLLHYHRGSGNGLKRHRPWEIDDRIDDSWNRFKDRF